MDIKIKVGVVVTSKNHRVLLIKEKLSRKPTPLWNIVKGTYDGGETICETAKRECREEANIDVNLVHLISTHILETDRKIRVQFNFLAKAQSMDTFVSPQKKQKQLNEQIEKTQWFTQTEIKQMRPAEFASERAYRALHEWMSGCRIPLDACKYIKS